MSLKKLLLCCTLPFFKYTLYRYMFDRFPGLTLDDFFFCSLTSVLIGLWVVHTCSAAVPNGAHNLEEDQQSVKPNNGNRLFNRAIRGSQNNAPATRLNAPAKSQSVSFTDGMFSSHKFINFTLFRTRRNQNHLRVHLHQ